MEGLLSCLFQYLRKRGRIGVEVNNGITKAVYPSFVKVSNHKKLNGKNKKIPIKGKGPFLISQIWTKYRMCLMKCLLPVHGKRERMVRQVDYGIFIPLNRSWIKIPIKGKGLFPNSRRWAECRFRKVYFGIFASFETGWEILNCMSSKAAGPAGPRPETPISQLITPREFQYI